MAGTRLTRSSYVQASYLLPAFGNYDKHISGCRPTNKGFPDGWRSSSWHDRWCMEGVRIERRDSKRNFRNVCAFVNKGTDWGIAVHSVTVSPK